ncbi:uncharacterized protein LOC129922947 [Biomphalaria glabrata]|uniref:Uncharacterized protein LOC129922947 n=1 Tax=Biomphalaria glabrata TaxID=6526 RepID=A0A9W2YWZ9_BIOGL|nr:uncharacterized protein LOC129922947 [Biomphalaria glabrata]
MDGSNYAAETSAEGYIKATVIYPNGTKNCRQLPLMDEDGDDMKISEIKKMLFDKLPDHNPEDYNLVLFKEEGRFIAADTEGITDYFDQIYKDKYTITFEKRED